MVINKMAREGDGKEGMGQPSPTTGLQGSMGTEGWPPPHPSFLVPSLTAFSHHTTQQRKRHQNHGTIFLFFFFFAHCLSDFHRGYTDVGRNTVKGIHFKWHLPGEP